MSLHRKQSTQSAKAKHRSTDCVLQMVVGHPEKLQKGNLISQDTDSQLVRGNAAKIMIYLTLWAPFQL